MNSVDSPEWREIIAWAKVNAREVIGMAFLEGCNALAGKLGLPPFLRGDLRSSVIAVLVAAIRARR